MTNMTKIPPNPFILIDGSSYLYRAFHALPPLMTSKGEPTGALYGVINMLRKLLNDYKPEYVAVVFDAKGKTFRDELFEHYKATRPAMPDALQAQIEPLHAIIKAMGLPVIMIEGVEADDVIGTLAIRAEKQGMQVLISTGDKDMVQLVNDQITLINTMSNTVLTPQTAEVKFGIPPHLMVDYLALVGDSIDNIPGVPNVGPKTAVKWLKEYGSLDSIIANATKITGKIGENLRANMSTLALSKELASMKLDVDIPITLSDLVPSTPDYATLTTLFKNFEFRNWLAEVLEKHHAQTIKTAHYETIVNLEAFENWLQRLKNSKLFAFDMETTSLNNIEAEIVGLSFALAPGEAAYIPIGHRYPNAPQQLPQAEVLTRLKPLLEDATRLKIGHNIKYDMEVLANHGIVLAGAAYDTMLESYILNSSAARHDMDSLALKYLGKKPISYEDVAGKGAKMVPFDQVSVASASQYAAEDADMTLQLHEALWPQLEKLPGQKKIFIDIEMPLVPVLARMERYGVLVDADKLRTQGKELGQRLQQLEQEAYSLAGEEFNLGSPKQLQTILFEKLKLPISNKTPKGQPSTAEAVLQELAYDYPLPKLILEHRSLSKLKSTYTDTLAQQVQTRTGRLHTCYNQAIAATGRLSSTDPNLQNIPIRTMEGRRIRQSFIAPPGYKIISADYSQIELRIMAHLSEDEGLINAFKQDLDIHKATAAEVFGLALNEVTQDQRRSAKAINFGLIYGMSPFGLSQQINVPPELAKVYMDRYFQRYPRVKAFMEATRKWAHQTGCVETLFGRRLYLPEINASQIMRQRAAERAAINAPMQGSAADIIKIAMLQVDHWLQTSKIKAHMIMQVHDELVFEVAEEDIDQLIPQIKAHMTNAAKLKVPLIVDVGIGNNWDEAH